MKNKSTCIKTGLINFKHGLTLIELLVTLTVFSIVITLTLSVLFKFQNTQTNLDKKLQITREIDRVAARLEKALRTTPQLIAIGGNYFVCLTQTGDTLHYFLKADTLFENNHPVSNLIIDSFAVAGIVKKEENNDKNIDRINDYYSSVENNIKRIAGLKIYLRIRMANKKIVIRKLFITLRNNRS